MGDFDDAEDIAQESFTKIFKSAKELDEVKNFSSWFYTIATNAAKTKLKEKKRFISINEGNVEEIEGLTSRLESALEIEFDAQQIKLHYLKKGINLLKPRLREVVLLRYFENFDYEKIANVTGLPIGTVKSRVNRGTEKLKEILHKIYNTKNL